MCVCVCVGSRDAREESLGWCKKKCSCHSQAASSVLTSSWAKVLLEHSEEILGCLEQSLLGQDTRRDRKPLAQLVACCACVPLAYSHIGLI